MKNKRGDLKRKTRNEPFLSDSFKLWIVVVMFLIVLFHFYAMKYLHHSFMASNTPLLAVLVLFGSIWFLELKDRRRLQTLNQNLIETQKRLEQAEIDTIAALILAEEEKDPYTRGHSKRVADYSLVIAREMDFSEEKQKIIERAGLLHDLGKIGIEDGVLKKSGKLNGEEWEKMKEHPERAVAVLKPLEFLSKEKEIVLHHHERCDGKGYPKGLKNDEIPIGSRIVAVADIFDSMNTERPYRKPLPKDTIISELKNVSGDQLDPSVTNVFLALLEQNPEFWKNES